MICKCSQCNLSFNETSIQYYKRMKNNSAKICRDCNRINNAENTAKKRKEKKDMPFEQLMEQVLLKHKKLYGTLSIPFIMRKFKLSYEESRKWKEKLDPQ